MADDDDKPPAPESPALVAKRARDVAYSARNSEKKKAKAAEWYANNKDRAAATNAAYYAKNKERAKAVRAAYRAKNKQRQKAWAAAWYLANLDATREKVRSWQEANPDQCRELKRNRKARVRGAKGRHTQADIDRIYGLQGGKCAYCKKKVGSEYHVDHIVPLSKGGSNWPANLQILCPTCNQSKSANDPIEHARSLGLLL